MKRLTTIVMLLLGMLQAHAITHSYSGSSVLSSGTWVKIRVSESGVHRLTYEQLQQAGLRPDSVRIYGYGGVQLSQNFNIARTADDLPPVPFYMHTGADGVFGRGDYILFYAQANIGWSYNGTRFAHTRNTYSDYGYYFLSDNAGTQVLLEDAGAASIGSGTDVTSYTALALHEEDLVNLVDPDKGEDGGGREFYGEVFSSSVPTRTFRIPFSDMTGSDVQVFVAMASAAQARSTFNVTLGGNTISGYVNALSSDHYTMAIIDSIRGTLTPSTGTSTQTVGITYRPGNSNGRGWLNYIELAAECSLNLRQNTLIFRTTKGYKESDELTYHLKGATAATQVWDITNPTAIRRVPVSMNGTELIFSGSNADGVHEYVAVNPNGSQWLEPEIIGSVANQNLHALHSIDLVIISPAEWVDAASDLGRAHEQYDGLTWAAVTDQQVYKEFSSGTPDASAYRWLMKMLWDRGTGARTKPQYLLLFGDGTFDNRKLLTLSGNNTLLTYQAVNSTVETQAYATDDYFGFMRNTDGMTDTSGWMEIGVGRLPVSTANQAREVTDKLIRYMRNESPGKWKNRLCFLADDGDNGLHTQTAEGGAEEVRRKNPDFIVKKIYLDAYTQEVSASGESYPVAKNRLTNMLTEGTLYMNYSGHAGNNNITNEEMLHLSDIQVMNNKNMGFWMLATCNFAHFDGGKTCAAREAVLNPNGGAIGVLSACRTVYANENMRINRLFCDTLFGHKDIYSYEMTVGNATRIAKNLSGNSTNKMSYVLLGDPALRLAYPTEYHVQTTLLPDTIRALSIHRIEGCITDRNGDTATWFNGTVDVTVLDKLQLLTTLDNDEKDPDKRVKLTYVDYPNTLFSGTAEVKDGKFAFRFMAPKDIRYNYGNGRIVYYANDPDNHAEAVGHEERFIIGGSSIVTWQDTIGPDIRLYLNNSEFTDGGDTHEHPHFYAELYDENGINTVGSGIGHDLLMIVDDDPNQIQVLNDYFISSNGSYQRGIVSYRMQEQSEGSHRLTFRAWDLLNNSNTVALNFNVIKGLDPTVFSVMTYPNPIKASGVMTVEVAYDRPDELIETDIYVYNTAGQVVWTSSTKDAQSMQWNLGGLNTTPGIYIYRVVLSTQSGQHTSKTGKIIVTQ